MALGDKPLTHAEIAAEAHRSQMVWYREYMNMGRFSTCYMREANILLDAAEHARKLLIDMDGKPRAAIIGQVESVLDKAIREAQKIRLNSVQPQPAPLEVRKAFLWMAEQEGMSVSEVNSSFVSAATQALWLAFQKGALWAQKRTDQPVAVEKPKRRLLDVAPKKGWLG